jgi:urea transport system permease protein
MAHGELLMLGGYFAWGTLGLVPGPLGILVALPVAFLGSAAVGAVIETALIRRLSARPLDTLLGTWGVSLILQQAARDLSARSGSKCARPTGFRGMDTGR